MKKWIFAIIFAVVTIESSFAMPTDAITDKGFITREEFFAMLGETEEECVSDELKFTFEDVEDISLECEKYVYSLTNEGIITGSIIDGKSYLEPKREITRMETAVILTKFLGIYSTAPCELNDTDIPDWASSYIGTAVNFGLMNLDETGYFNANNNLLRYDAEKIMESLNDKGYFDEKNIKVYAGTGMSYLVDGSLDQAVFFAPTGIIKYKNAIYIADNKNNSIRKIKDDKVTTVAGDYSVRDEFDVVLGSFADGNEAKFDSPSFLATPKNGILVTDTNNNLIRYFSGSKVSTYAGNIEGGYKDGKRSKALFNNPTGIVATDRGIIYIADTGNNVIRKIDRNDNVTTYAGVMSEDGGYKDGKASEAMFNRPMGLFLKNGALYVVDCGNQRIRKIEDGKVTTVAGGGEETYDDSNEIIGDYIDGSLENARFNFPQNVIFDDEGNMYVADTGNSAIRKIDKAGFVYTIAGLSSNDDVEIISPVGLMIDGSKLYVTDTVKNNIIVIDIREAE